MPSGIPSPTLNLISDFGVDGGTGMFLKSFENSENGGREGHESFTDSSKIH